MTWVLHGALLLVAGGLGWVLARRVPRPEPVEWAGLDAQRRFAANVSHELRTPLTVQRAAVEVALADPEPTVESLRRMALRVHASTLRQERLIDGLLALSTVRHTVEEPVPVDLAEVARAAVDSVSGKDIHVVDDLAPAWAAGDPDLLARLAANLVDNAVRHNRPGGWARVRTAVEAGAAMIEVANSGSAISAGAAPFLFEPFRRRSAKAGFGLGLSIVESIVASHRGSLSAQALDGGGLRIRVELPRGDRPRHGETGGSRPPGSVSGRGS